MSDKLKTDARVRKIAKTIIERSAFMYGEYMGKLSMEDIKDILEFMNKDLFDEDDLNE